MTMQRNCAFLLLIGSLLAAPASAHELWIETEASTVPGLSQEARVLWGHGGVGQGGPSLAQQADKLSAVVISPTGSVESLELTLGEDCFIATLPPRRSGRYALGAELQTGIIDQQLHDILPKTRITMYGKAIVKVGAAEASEPATLGHDLEFVPLSDTAALRVGDTLVAKVLLHGKPLGGRNALVSLATSGNVPPSDDPRVVERQWSIESTADPVTGEIAFPLIVEGRHTLRIRYFDETPGVYDGDRNDESDFSHLKKGDTYERTMYIATFTFDVSPR